MSCLPARISSSAYELNKFSSTIFSFFIFIFSKKKKKKKNAEREKISSADKSIAPFYFTTGVTFRFFASHRQFTIGILKHNSLIYSYSYSYSLEHTAHTYISIRTTRRVCSNNTLVSPGLRYECATWWCLKLFGVNGKWTASAAYSRLGQFAREELSCDAFLSRFRCWGNNLTSPTHRYSNDSLSINFVRSIQRLNDWTKTTRNNSIRLGGERRCCLMRFERLIGLRKSFLSKCQK